VQSDDQVAGVPATHGQREERKQLLDAGQLAAMPDQLEQHPKWQQRTNAIADDLKDFERIEWRHLGFKELKPQKSTKATKALNSPQCSSMGT